MPAGGSSAGPAAGTTTAATGGGGYPLFRLEQSVALRGPPEVASVKLLAHGTTATHSALALYCCNDTLVLRLSTAAEQHVRTIPWPAGQSIVAMRLDPAAEWLLLATVAGSLHLLPLLALLSPTARLENPRLAPTHDITSAPPSRLLASSTALAFWQTFSGQQLALVAAAAGIAVVSLPSFQQLHMAKLRQTATHIEVMRDDSNALQYALVETPGGHFRLLLEREVLAADGRVRQTLVDTALPDFTLQPLRRFRSETHLSSCERRSMAFVGAHDYSDMQQRLLLYSISLDRDPLYVYQLPARTAQVLLTDSLHFCAQNSREPTLVVGSNLLAGIPPDADLSRARDVQQRAVMQIFHLPVGEAILGLFPTPSAAAALAGCTVVTSQGVYDVVPDMAPNDIFLGLLAAGENPEPLGTTLQLDIFSLYERAADSLFDAGEHQRAMDLYVLANIPPETLIPKFAAQTALMPMAISFLRTKLSDSGSLNSRLRKRLADLLFLSYVHQLRISVSGEVQLSSSPRLKDRGFAALRDSASAEVELFHAFSKFIQDDWDYSINSALLALLHNGLTSLFFTVSQARALVPQALSQLINHGLPALTWEARDFLYTNKHAPSVCDRQGGVLLRCMPPDEAVRFLVTQGDAVALCINHALPLLPRLGIPALLKLAKFLDPTRPPIRALIKSSKRLRAPSTSSATSFQNKQADGEAWGGQLTAEAVVEAFLHVMLALGFVRRRENLDIRFPYVHEPFCASVLPDMAGAVADEQPLEAAGNSPSPVPEDFEDVDPSSINGGDVLQTDTLLAFGTHHGAVVVGDDLYSWGRTQHGRLGHGSIIEETPWVPVQRIETLTMLGIRVRGVACGAEHMLARCDEGVFSWGSATHGQLGMGDNVRRSRPTAISELSDKNIVVVECGDFHSLAISDDNTLWAWGWGTHGQLGLPRAENCSTPTAVRALDQHRITQVAAGHCHTVVLTATGQVLTFGSNKFGQIGHEGLAKVTQPKAIPSLSNERVYLIGCGQFKTIMVTVEDNVYWCGRSYRPNEASLAKRQSGMLPARFKVQPHQMQPAKVDLGFTPGKIVQVVAGKYHCLLLTDEGMVASWGGGDYGQLGHGATIELLSPRPINSRERIVRVAAGEEFSGALDATGQVWVWGCGSAGELGSEPKAHSSRNTPMLLPGVPEPRNLSATSSFSDASVQGMPRSPTPRSIAIPRAPLSREAAWSFSSNASLARSASGTSATGASPRTPQRQPRPAHLSLPVRMSSQVPPMGAGAGSAAVDDLVLPNFASPPMPYGRDALPAALSSLRGFYRATVVMRLCADWKDHDTLAYLYSMLGNGAMALEHRLLAIEDFVRRSITDPARRASATITSAAGGDSEGAGAGESAGEGREDKPSRQQEATQQLGKMALDTARAYLRLVAEQVRQAAIRERALEDLAGGEAAAAAAAGGVAAAAGSGAAATAAAASEGLGSVLDYSGVFHPLRLAMLAVLRFWDKHGLELVLLETLLREVMGVTGIGPVLLHLVHEADIGQAGDGVLRIPSLILGFDSSFYLDLGLACTDKADVIDDLHEGKVSEARLWREIIDNLSKDLLARDRINVQHVRKSSSSRGGNRDGASAHGNSGDTVIFTCGHDFAHRDFVDSVLPELRKRLQELPTPLPISDSLIVGEYLKKRISLACPRCLFGQLRREEMEASPMCDVRPW